MVIKIVLMRSQEEPADAYCERLKDLGEVHCIPVLSFNFINLPQLCAYLASPQHWGGIIFTSKRAVEAVRLAVESQNLSTEWSAKSCYVVGKATEKVASKLGFSCSGADSGNADKLAEKIKHSYLSRLPLLFLCGNLRRDTLPSSLETNKIPYQNLTVYETVAWDGMKVKIDEYIDKFGLPSHIVYFSPSGYQLAHHIWDKLMKTAGKDVNVVAIGSTTATDMIGGRVLVSKQPNPQALYEVIKECKQR